MNKSDLKLFIITFFKDRFFRQSCNIFEKLKLHSFWKRSGIAISIERIVENQIECNNFLEYAELKYYSSYSVSSTSRVSKRYR